MCRGYFSSQEIDSHHATEHRSTDQSRNGCRMCCFCHAQRFEITRAKNKMHYLATFIQNGKVVEAFCHAACRLSNQCRPSIHQPPVDEFRVPAEMSIALSRAHLHARMHVASCWRRVHHRDRHQHTIPMALAALPGAILPATSCLGAFWTPASSVCRACRRCRRPQTSTKALDQGCPRGQDQTSSAAHGPHTAIIFLEKSRSKRFSRKKNAKTINRFSKLSQ
jgi:hypothetical protein